MKVVELIDKLMGLPYDADVLVMDPDLEASTARLFVDMVPESNCVLLADRPLQGSNRTCRTCGCTDADCRQCIEKTGAPCHWIEDDLCSACGEPTT